MLRRRPRSAWWGLAALTSASAIALGTLLWYVQDRAFEVQQHSHVRTAEDAGASAQFEVQSATAKPDDGGEAGGTLVC